MNTHENLFGDIAVKKGFITEDQVKKALEIQKKDAMEEELKPLGIILYEMGLMTVYQVTEVLNSLNGS